MSVLTTFGKVRPGLILWSGLAILVTGCAGSSAAVQRPSAATAFATGEYLVGAGDTLQIFVWRQPELSMTVPVRPDGRISTPLVEDLVVVNKTPSQIAREIEERLAEYIRSPQVNVIVQDFVGAFGAQIRVLGQAVQPRSIPYRDRMTLLDVVIEAGGLTEFAAGNRTRVVRTVDGETREIRVRLDDLVKRGDIEENILMQPGDVVIIPEAVF
ncbi:MAG TPA: XrtA/PEP-CTERM system exopolysaccharide export protein [Gammaproteobacteria bacterium]